MAQNYLYLRLTIMSAPMKNSQYTFKQGSLDALLSLFAYADKSIMSDSYHYSTRRTPIFFNYNLLEYPPK